MNDRTLSAIFDKPELDGKIMQGHIENILGMVIAGIPVTQESTAVALYGYTMTATKNKLPSAKDVKVYLESIAKKPVKLMTEPELLALAALGFLRKKPRMQPFQSIANKYGRNEQCPCGSGQKYKNCCLDLAKTHDAEEYAKCRG